APRTHLLQGGASPAGAGSQGMPWGYAGAKDYRDGRNSLVNSVEAGSVKCNGNSAGAAKKLLPRRAAPPPPRSHAPRGNAARTPCVRSGTLGGRDAERPRTGSHAERGNQGRREGFVPPTRPPPRAAVVTGRG